MKEPLSDYEPIVGKEAVGRLRRLGQHLSGLKIVHVNSTKVGGGVAEILNKMVPLMSSLGLAASWEIITGDADFFVCTKGFHNGLQGHLVDIKEKQLAHYEKINAQNAEKLRSILNDADIVIIHDPQPCALIEHFPKRKGKWVWRCHIDASLPDPKIWNFLEKWIVRYDASIFTIADFTKKLPHPIYLVPPSIDPLTDKNRELKEQEINRVFSEFNIDPNRPFMVQVSRYDIFKDPIGVIQAYKIAKTFHAGIQLVFAGGSADDDPEGDAVLRDVKKAAGNDPDIKCLMLPPDAHLTVNALQRACDIVVQKSVREGFGLTVTEGLWKGKPVIGGNVGGIRLQIKDYKNGFLANTPEGAAEAIRFLLDRPEECKEMGRRGKEFVRERFLITRHLEDYLNMIVTLTRESEERVLLQP